MPILVHISASMIIATVFGLSQVQALVILFVLLPVVVGLIFVPLMVRHLSKGPRPMLTSEILANGAPAEAKIVRVRSLGNILDVKPMVRFDLQVTAVPSEEPFDLQVVQALPRSVVGVFKPGDIVRVRLAPDRSAGAIEWGYEAPDA